MSGSTGSMEAGYIEIADPGSDRTQHVGTLQCVHCGGHWIPQPGSGKTRGFCINCRGPICGEQCKDCVPMELMLENMEKGRDISFVPIIVPISFSGE